MILFNSLMAIYGQQSGEMAQFQSWLDFEVALIAADPGISTKAAIGSFSTFCTNLCDECSIQGICGASDEDMCLTFARRTAGIGPRATSVLRCRLKKCLMFLVPDAQHRWPNFWYQKTFLRLDDRRISKINTFPARVAKLRDQMPLHTVFGVILCGLRKHTNRGSVTSLRDALSFLDAYLFNNRGSLLSGDTSKRTAESILNELRHKNKDDICSAYTNFREHGRCSSTLSLSTLSKHIYILNALFVDTLKAFRCRILTDDFGVYSRKRRRQSSGSTHSHLSSCPSENFDIEKAQATEKMDLSNRLILRPRTNDIHTFNSREVRSLYLSCETLLDKILLCFLFGTGMRIGGFCRLQRGVQILQEGDMLNTREKGGKMVAYRLSKIMAVLLNEWISGGNAGNTYAFPHATHKTLHIQPRHVRKKFMSIANRAGVYGPHVHPHTTRHTVIWTLWALGNPVEIISKFVHHSQSSTTMERYIRPTDEEIHSTINMPWIGIKKNAKDNKRTAMELSLALASPFASQDGKTFPQALEQHTNSQKMPTTHQQTQICSKDVHFTLPVPHTDVNPAAVHCAETRAGRKRRREEGKILMRKMISDLEEMKNKKQRVL